MHFNIQKCLMSASGILGIALAGLVIGDDAPAPTQVVPGFDHRIRLLSFSSDGKALLIGNPGPAVNIWDPQMGALKDTVRIHEHVVHRIAASPDANVLASAGWDDREGKQRTVKIWDAPKGTLRHTIREETNVLLFSPDGKRLATNHGFAAIRIWDVETGKLHRELKAFQSTATVLSFSVMALAFSKDGKLLAAGSGQPFINGARLPPAEVRLWDMETGKLRHAQGGFSVVHSLAIAPDSTWLAIGVTMIVEGSSKRRLII
jgi:WD40 repeat protein